ncbi:class I SAM-dependent methyltransferase [Usitatibacter palustris]|uniref:Ubiquinone biosynthesis O-methyltransferase, mitochondrial n=1 Tax=Usitatibacter palustris TaxID=2732487 RepID=A0A6M4HAB4_9PROT|nr:class I SAM-dependent methyltransferase [Usitatibacter palustris]QJR16491.1 Ubiquinone biosynthesis O-methyltransferase, mitochondrial [Usitatibacter palustris]
MVTRCWCGTPTTGVFNKEYGACPACGGLVLLDLSVPGRKPVVDDEKDFYGKQYWLAHQAGDLGNPDIHARARSDLTERNLHWLAAILAYKLPPAAIVEVGCAHGSLVALLQMAGFDAAGSEMSPWVVEYARKTFGIRMHVGPVESLAVAPGSLDALAMMDVLEHLPDPAATLRRCLALLKTDGVLVIQTPQYREGVTHAQMLASADPFLEQLKPDEHLYLFTDRGLRKLLVDVGAPHQSFEPAIFAHYDMFVVASRKKVVRHAQADIDEALLASPGGRMVLALLDLRKRETALFSELASARSDIEFLKQKATTQVGGAPAADFSFVEADRVARGHVIENQGQRISQLEAEVHQRLGELNVLHDEAEALRNERNLVSAQKDDLQRNFDFVEADRIARGNVIEQQGQRISTLEGEVHRRLEELTSRETQAAALRAQVEALKSERSALEGQKADTQRNFDLVEADRRTRGSMIEQQALRIAELEREANTGAQELMTLGKAFDVLKGEHGDLGRQLGVLEQAAARDRSRWWHRLGRKLKLL